MRRIAFAASLLALVGFTPAAKAVPVDVTYNVTTTLQVLGGALGIGSGVGTTTVRYRGAAGNPTTGSAQIRTINLANTINVNGAVLGQSWIITGTQMLTAGPVAPRGTVTGSWNFAIPLTGVGLANIHCTNTVATPVNGCTGLSLPSSIPVAAPISIGTTLAGTAAPGPFPTTFTVSGIFGTFQGISITAISTLSEASRTTIPEPTSLSLLWIGLAGLAGGRSWQRRRTRVV